MTRPQQPKFEQSHFISQVDGQGNWLDVDPFRAVPEGVAKKLGYTVQVQAGQPLVKVPIPARSRASDVLRDFVKTAYENEAARLGLLPTDLKPLHVGICVVINGKSITRLYVKSPLAERKRFHFLWKALDSSPEEEVHASRLRFQVELTTFCPFIRVLVAEHPDPEDHPARARRTKRVKMTTSAAAQEAAMALVSLNRDSGGAETAGGEISTSGSSSRGETTATDDGQPPSSPCSSSISSMGKRKASPLPNNKKKARSLAAPDPHCPPPPVPPGPPPPPDAAQPLLLPPAAAAAALGALSRHTTAILHKLPGGHFVEERAWLFQIVVDAPADARVHCWAAEVARLAAGAGQEEEAALAIRTAWGAYQRSGGLLGASAALLRALAGVPARGGLRARLLESVLRLPAGGVARHAAHPRAFLFAAAAASDVDDRTHRLVRHFEAIVAACDGAQAAESLFELLTSAPACRVLGWAAEVAHLATDDDDARRRVGCAVRAAVEVHTGRPEALDTLAALLAALRQAEFVRGDLRGSLLDSILCMPEGELAAHLQDPWALFVSTSLGIGLRHAYEPAAAAHGGTAGSGLVADRALSLVP